MCTDQHSYIDNVVIIIIIVVIVVQCLLGCGRRRQSDVARLSSHSGSGRVRRTLRRLQQNQIKSELFNVDEISLIIKKSLKSTSNISVSSDLTETKKIRFKI